MVPDAVALARLGIVGVGKLLATEAKNEDAAEIPNCLTSTTVRSSRTAAGVGSGILTPIVRCGSSRISLFAFAVDGAPADSILMAF